MSARDAAKLQDLPQSYAFAGSRTAVFSQIGMGVPVSLGRASIRHVRRALGLALAPLDESAGRVPDGTWPLEYSNA
ncbi:MAG: hypothetical protein ACI9VR_001160 [Cognaticolwellia sp.]|jgi:hypothetical protein